jgi:hypothetical protein
MNELLSKYLLCIYSWCFRTFCRSFSPYWWCCGAPQVIATLHPVTLWSAELHCWVCIRKISTPFASFPETIQSRIKGYCSSFFLDELCVFLCVSIYLLWPTILELVHSSTWSCCKEETKGSSHSTTYLSVPQHAHAFTVFRQY